MCINVYQYRCVRSAPKCACDRARACSLAISPIVGAHASNIKPMFLPAGLTNPKLISCKKNPKEGIGGCASRHPPYAQWAPKDLNSARDGLQDGPIWLPRWP